jgi:hypothetical protein
MKTDTTMRVTESLMLSVRAEGARCVMTVGLVEEKPDGTFRALVKRMRDAQKKYFRSKALADLDRAKDLEHDVDIALHAEVQPRLPGVVDEPRAEEPEF